MSINDKTATAINAVKYSAEQAARALLDRMGVPNAQAYSSGDLVELANLIAASAQRAPVAYLDLDKLAVGGMAYATSIRTSDKQTALAAITPCVKPGTAPASIRYGATRADQPYPCPTCAAERAQPTINTSCMARLLREHPEFVWPPVCRTCGRGPCTEQADQPTDGAAA